ncbi:unnamed protein product [Meloidogyne enterolobii]|uniref:Uncharacterized protein n=1 Tax=Meloidogyne enterolobii TaxID=390850 RepID=A0ACB1ALJ8_MELEN
MLKAGNKGKGPKKSKADKAFYPKALILLPTRELADQTYREVLKLTYRTPLVPALVHGGQNNFETQLANLKVCLIFNENMLKTMPGHLGSGQLAPQARILESSRQNSLFWSSLASFKKFLYFATFDIGISK